MNHSLRLVSVLDLLLQISPVKRRESTNFNATRTPFGVEGNVGCPYDQQRPESELREQHLFEDIIANYAEVIRLDPSYAFAFNERGNTYQEQGELDLVLRETGSYRSSVNEELDEATRSSLYACMEMRCLPADWRGEIF